MAGAAEAFDRTLEDANRMAGRDGFRYRLFATGTGMVGGAFGFAGLAVELPVSTLLILRSITAIARDYGEDSRDPTTGLECLSVFSLGGGSRADDAMNSSYLSTRLGMASLMRDAGRSVAAHGARTIAEALRRGGRPRRSARSSAGSPRGSTSR